MTITVMKDPTVDIYDYTYAKGGKNLVSKWSQSISTFKAASLSYALPSVLFPSKDASWVKSNVLLEISDGSASILSQASISADRSEITFSDMHAIVAGLTKNKYSLKSTAYSLKLKTSLKAQTVDKIDYSQSKWSNCVHFAELLMTFKVSTNATSSIPVFSPTLVVEEVEEEKDT